jgi:hypothetical protein
VDDETGLVVGVEGAAEDAPILLVGLLDVLEAPGRPELLAHRFASEQAAPLAYERRRLAVRREVRVVRQRAVI